MTAYREMIKIILADDHPITCKRIRMVLQQAADINLIGEAINEVEAKKLVTEFYPRILLLNFVMPNPQLTEIIKWARDNYPETATLVLSGRERDAHLTQMFDAGAAGYLSDSVSGEMLISAIRRVAKDSSIFDEQQLARVQRWKNNVAQKWESLTQREREIFCVIAGGKENKEVATLLKLTPKTVEKHLGNIYEKLGVKSKTEAALWWVENCRDFPN